MPTATFEVTVESNKDTGKSALADASRYLAYGDTTDIFGYHANITDTKERIYNGSWYITISFEAPVVGNYKIKQWKTEMDRLSRVENAECVSNPIAEATK